VNGLLVTAVTATAGGVALLVRTPPRTPLAGSTPPRTTLPGSPAPDRSSRPFQGRSGLRLPDRWPRGHEPRWGRGSWWSRVPRWGRRRRSGTGARRPGRTGRAEELRAVAELADRLAAVLRAGISPSRSWTALAGPPGGQARVEAPARPLSSGTRGTRSRTGRNDAVGEVVQLVAAAVAAGAGEAEAIRAAASQSPAPGVGRSVAWLGVAWEVGVTTGAPLAEVLDGFCPGRTRGGARRSASHRRRAHAAAGRDPGPGRRTRCRPVAVAVRHGRGAVVRAHGRLGVAGRTVVGATARRLGGGGSRVNGVPS